MKPVHRNRPLKPISYVVAPLAFWLTRVVRPIFDTISPEKTKYEYRVADSRTDGARSKQYFQAMRIADALSSIAGQEWRDIGAPEAK